jgi:hypothetical protein
MAGFSHLGRSVRICNRSSQLEIWEVFCEVFISAFYQSSTRPAKFPCSAAIPWIFLQLISCKVTCWKLRYQISSLVQCLTHRKLYSESYLIRDFFLFILKLRFYYKIISKFRSSWNSNVYTTVIVYLISNISLLIRKHIQLKQLFFLHHFPHSSHISHHSTLNKYKKTHLNKNHQKSCVEICP